MTIINNGSTIDTLIEKERDIQLIERLDKKNRINLKQNNFKKNLIDQLQTNA